MNSLLSLYNCAAMRIKQTGFLTLNLNSTYVGDQYQCAIQPEYSVTDTMAPDNIDNFLQAIRKPKTEYSPERAEREMMDLIR